MGIACAEPPAYRDCMSPSQIPDSIFKQLTILVVAANAGIYTPRRSFWEKLFAGFRATTQACGYVSRRSPGRRRGRIFKMHVRILATRCARGLRELSRLEIRGRRECRVHAAPAVSRAKLCKKNAHEHTGSAEAIRHSLRNGFTAYIALSPAIGLSCHRRLRCCHRKLDAGVEASGPHDFTVRLSAVRQ
jgi:hypothetical protein